MKMTELLRYDLPAELIALWQAEESEALLPLQEAAVKRHGLFGEKNLLIQAPTSSGKTFIGEMAALHTALRRKKVVYLVPLKALAEEKYRDFQAKYAAYGLKVLIATRDHREHDRELEEGDFSIAVVVYEKLAQLVVRRPERMKEIALVIADELELLSDPERGATVELLLTRLLLPPAPGEKQCRLVGLSAVLGGADRLAEWMGATLVQHERRPVELRYGVLCDGVFHYRSYNDCSEGEEKLAAFQSQSAWEVLTQNVARMAEAGESCLIFVKAKHESRRGAELLAEQLTLSAATDAIETLRTFEPTRSRDVLLHTLANGVAFHNADLAPEERQVVEEAFRSGAAPVMVSTSTLAAGMNLPARNVFISADKWRYDARLDIPWKTPISRAEFENMGGRAGRYGAGHAYGRALLVATTPFEQETYRRRYVEAEREAIEPRLAKESLENHVLRLAASRFCRTAEELQVFLDRTISGQWVWAEYYTPEEIAFRIRAAINRCCDAGAITTDAEGRLEATPFGLAAASKGISIETARQFEHWIGESETRTWRPLDLIFAAASTPDGRMFQVMLTAREYEQGGYPEQLKRRTAEEPLQADTPVNRLRNCTLTPFFEEVRAIKIALFLEEWIEQGALCSLEEQYYVMAGQVLSAAEQVSWLVDAAAAVAKALGCRQDFIDAIETLAARVQFGLREELLPLARMPFEGLSRNAVLALYAQDLHTIEAIAAAAPRAMQQWVPAETARGLQQWAQALAPAPPQPPAPAKPPAVLVVDERHPGEIRLDGETIGLQEKQYRMLRRLAASAGECVAYDVIYEAVWGDAIVEPNQMHFQKRELLRRITARLPERSALIKTVNKRGYVLQLKPEEVAVHSQAVSDAA